MPGGLRFCFGRHHGDKIEDKSGHGERKLSTSSGIIGATIIPSPDDEQTA